MEDAKGSQPKAEARPRSNEPAKSESNRRLAAENVEVDLHALCMMRSTLTWIARCIHPDAWRITVDVSSPRIWDSGKSS